MFVNDQKYGRMVTEIQLYLEKHPELYENPDEIDNAKKVIINKSFVFPLIWPYKGHKGI